MNKALGKWGSHEGAMDLKFLGMHNSIVLNVVRDKRKSKEVKMIILEKYRLLQKLIGLHEGGGRERILIRILYSVVLISFNSIEVIYIILNARDGIEQAVSGLCAIGGIIPALASYAYLLVNRKRYYSVLDEMQQIVDEST